MALDKQRTYMVLNYSSSPVSIVTRDRSYMLEGGTRENPAVIPLTIDEINTANTNGCAFKYGCAFFEPEYQKEIYEELRLLDWQNILRDEQIEDIILNPTKDGLEKLVAIDNEIYFGRVYGTYKGLKSIFAEVSPRVELVIEQRRSELKANQRKSEIIISKPIQNSGINTEEVDDLKARLAKMEALLAQKFEAPNDSNSQSITPALQISDQEPPADVKTKDIVPKPRGQRKTNK